MDATQKRRMWKVAIGYFALTAFAFLNSIFLVNSSIAYMNSSEFWQWIFLRLQPICWLLHEAVQSKQSFAMDSNQSSNWFVGITFCLSVPLWSICFGWIFAKLDNWLNHFPVLGRKVF